MRIGIDIRNIGKKRTGDEAVFFNLVKNLAQIDSENEYLLFTDVADENILEKIRKDLEITDKSNFKIISLSQRERGVSFLNNKFIWNIWTLPRYLRKNPVDAYHTQYILPFFIPKKIKLITTIHDISFNFYPQFIKFTDLFFLKIFIPWSLKRADKIIAVSKFTKNEIVKYYKIAPEKIEVAYNSMRTADYESAHANNNLEEIRKKYNLPEKFILYLGTMQPRKNLPFLIEGYAGIKNKLPDIKLVIAGNLKSYNFDRRISQSVKNHKLDDDVIFPGFIDEEHKPMIYKMAHLFIFPSLYEGFGIPILEAMGADVPIVASDIPAHREVAGNAAVYFNPADLANFQDKLYNASVDENLRKNQIDLSREQVQFFSWKKTAAKIAAIYNHINN